MTTRRMVPGCPAAIALSLSLIAVAFRFLSFRDFADDHFIGLAVAQAITAGDRPIRDYTEAGAPLDAMLSASFQLAFGPGVFAELCLTLLSLGVAAAVTCWLTTHLTGSPALGVWASLLQIAVMPRLYGHPKILIYPVLGSLAYWYVREPRRSRVLFMAAWTAAAFLLRHDHGVYCAVGSGSAMLAANWMSGWRRVARAAATYTAAVLLCLAPYLAYIEWHGDMAGYLANGIRVSRVEAGRGSWGWPRVERIPLGPIVVIKPTPLEHMTPVSVRWRDGLSARRRQDREIAHGLFYGAPRDDQETWSYRIKQPATKTLQALVRDPDIADTNGFDRRTFVLEDTVSVATRVLAASGLDRLHPGPPIAALFSRANATALVFYAAFASPFVAFVLLNTRRGIAATAPNGSAAVLMLAVVALVTFRGFVRSPDAARLPDAFGTAPIVMAWTLAALRERTRHPRARPIAAGVIQAAAVTLLIAAAVMTDLPGELRVTGATDGPSGVAARAVTVWHRTRTWPWTFLDPASARMRLIRYVHRCTGDEDRLFVAWNAPDLNFYARRPFAGGEITLSALFAAPSDVEPRVVARLAQQQVAMVLESPERSKSLWQTYPRLAAYVAPRYRPAGTIRGEEEEYVVRVDANRAPDHVDVESGLPCFRRLENGADAEAQH